MTTPNPTPPSAEAMARAKAQFLAKTTPEANTGCVLWTGATIGNGYGSFHLFGRNATAHNAGYQLFVGPIPAGKEVCHKCDVRLCVNMDHLFVGTHTENMRDCMAKGRYKIPPPRPIGAAHPRYGSKLVKSQVIEIMKLKGRGISSATLRSLFNVGRTTCDKIWNGRSWNHITGLPKRSPSAALATHSDGKGAGHFTKVVQAMVNTACDEDLHALTAEAIIGDLNKGNGHRPECRCAICSPPDAGGTKEGA